MSAKIHRAGLARANGCANDDGNEHGHQQHRRIEAANARWELR
jgi:hypothetical protein